MNKPKIALCVKVEKNDCSVQLRIQAIDNGFLVRTGHKPVFFDNIDDVIDAIGEALKTAATEGNFG